MSATARIVQADIKRAVATVMAIGGGRVRLDLNNNVIDIFVGSAAPAAPESVDATDVTDDGWDDEDDAE